MALTKSAQKRVRQTKRRNVRNKSRLSETRNYVRKVEEAIRAGDAKAATEALKKAQPALHRTAAKGIVHKKTAARKLSRLNQSIKALK